MSGEGQRRVAVIGAGWAGLAAAVSAVERGWSVTLFEMARHAGGRARTVEHHGLALDNGQHILIGAYRQTLALMRRVGVEPDAVLLRKPLALVDAHGRGLRLPPGAAVPAFVRGVLASNAWPLAERLALLAAALRWRLAGFRAPPGQTVAELIAALPAGPRTSLIEPLCVAALNTPAAHASAAVFLRVLRDALFSAPGASDLLLPRVDLSRVLPVAASAWLQARGATLRWRHRVQALARAPAGWQVDGEGFDAVILAATALESARLAEAHAPAWAATAAAMRYEPIVTVWLRCPGTRLPVPMLALHADDAGAPAQFVFDLGALHNTEPAARGLLACVISGAAPWVAAGQEATAAAVRAQAMSQLGHLLATPPTVAHVVAERRATFACTPGLQRAPATVAQGLWAAGDHVEGPYPATLEGAVRAGAAAARSALA